MTSFFHGMIDMTPAAVRARFVHHICTASREVAALAHLAAHANDANQAQVRLDADQAGQRAYWTAMRWVEA